MIFIGTIGIFGYSTFLYSALSYLPAQEASVLNYLWPILVVIFLCILLKEKLTNKKIVALSLSFFGLLIVISKGNLFSFHVESK